MTKKYFVSLLLAFFAASAAFGQETPSEGKIKRGLPNIPGTFVLEFGFNQPFNKPDTLFSLGFWGSRTFNLYYQHDVRIAKSKFSVHPGIGFAFERFKFKDFHTLAYEEDGTVSFVPAFATLPSVRKSMLITNYLDVSAEIRFSTNPDDPGRSFRVSIGGRAGYLLDSFTKIKYKEDGEMRRIKDKKSFNLNDFRYGLSFKAGAGNFTIFSYYNLSPMFKTDEGPQQTEANNFTVGLSLSSF